MKSDVLNQIEDVEEQCRFINKCKVVEWHVWIHVTKIGT